MKTRIYVFEENNITFTLDKDSKVMVNATEMAKGFPAAGRGVFRRRAPAAKEKNRKPIICKTIKQKKICHPYRKYFLWK
jgi:hypothetical protein